MCVHLVSLPAKPPLLSSHPPDNRTEKVILKYFACGIGKIESNPRKWINKITENEMAYETFCEM